MGDAGVHIVVAPDWPDNESSPRHSCDVSQCGWYFKQ